jgi:catechol 2,3-dioxygenase-like lactoylglutathione lyase family enzyme
LEADVIDHTGVSVSDFARSKAFYTEALSAIGYALLMEFPASVTGHADVAGFGEPPKADFWVSRGVPNNPPVHVAFRVSTRAQVDAFYEAAIAAGGRDNGAPGCRPHYHEHYYGAFVLDPDGHNIEAVCHSPE